MGKDMNYLSYKSKKKHQAKKICVQLKSYWSDMNINFLFKDNIFPCICISMISFYLHW